MDQKRCAICGTESKYDLFAAVTGEAVCSICKAAFIGGFPTTQKRIEDIRAGLQLGDGEYLPIDRAKAARELLRSLS